jgi:hypothetical protein
MAVRLPPPNTHQPQVVGDSTTFHTLAAPPAARPGQLGKTAGLLSGPPLKPALAAAHVPPPPASMFLGGGWAPPPPGLLRDVSPDKWVAGPGRDFELCCPGPKSAVAGGRGSGGGGRAEGAG